MLSSAMPHTRIALDAPPPAPGMLITSARPCSGHVHPQTDQGPDHRRAFPSPTRDSNGARHDAHHDHYGEEDDVLVVVDPDALDFITHVPPLPPSLARTRASLLPPLAAANGKSHTLLLDVDECLVACRTVPIANPDLTFSVHFNGTRFDIYGKLRPGVHAFLQALRSSPWEVVLFTASQHCYATRIRALLDPDGDCIAHLLHRDHCVPVLGNYLKDLSALGRDLRKTIIVDNSPQAFAYHPANGIAVPSWYDDQTDRALARLLPTLAKLARHDDVRPAVFATSPLVARLTDHARHSGRVAVGLALALAAIHGDPPLDAPTPPMHLPHSPSPPTTRLIMAAGGGGGAWPQFHHVEEPEYMETWDHCDGHVRLLPLHASAWPALWRTPAERVAEKAAVPAAAAAVVVAVDPGDKRVSRGGDAARAADADYNNDLAPAEAAAAPAELLLAQGVPLDDEDDEGEAMELDIADEDAGDLTTSLVLCEHDRDTHDSDSMVPDASFIQDSASMHDPPAPSPPATWYPTAAPPTLDLSATATIEFPPTTTALDPVAASPLSWARPPSTTSTSKLARRCTLSPTGARAASAAQDTPTGRRPSWATPTAAPRATVIPGKTSRRTRANSVPNSLTPLALMPLTWAETSTAPTPSVRAATWGADDPMHQDEDLDAWVKPEPVDEMAPPQPAGARSPVVRRARRPGTPPVQLAPASSAAGGSAGAGEVAVQACGLALPSAGRRAGGESGRVLGQGR
ncbi:dullard-like phosphatase domain-containing protein [Allomyces macrogynus ATCC 38327]|uniref:Dullard-like phosphatase domain-containing protein n=1 Tax=Allomyces macrogynus (strain ATCC 38327) TaxID=578462 RepID=A0A0L0RY60_ALLM3|nr:dullard-like phosphatase domain-containing protein [Allomyces macrogynus ATCC 38327]|eukprot:KNE55337.1 dullard-like phosphatase domain-containing protein [Allomyces macrogynus ATCC 38327]